MTVQHTPIPWRTAQLGERIAFPDVHITGANGRPVASTMYPIAKSDWRAEDEANARFIILAVNSFDALLAACKYTLDEALAPIERFQFAADRSAAIGRAYNLLKDAIALAKEAQP